MSDTTTDTAAEASPYAISWATAIVFSVGLAAACIAFSYLWEAIAQAIGDF